MEEPAEFHEAKGNEEQQQDHQGHLNQGQSALFPKFSFVLEHGYAFHSRVPIAAIATPLKIDTA